MDLFQSNSLLLYRVCQLSSREELCLARALEDGMGVIKSLRSRSRAAAEKAVRRITSDPRRMEQIGELAMLVVKGRKALDNAQEATVKAIGLASSGDIKATNKRLALLRRSARRLDSKLNRLSDILDQESEAEHGEKVEE